MTVHVAKSGPTNDRSKWRLLGRRDPQLVRLREEEADVEGAIRHAVGSLDIARRREAEEHVTRAWRAAQDRDTDTGWGQAPRARELLILGFDDAAIHRTATELDFEVRLSSKLTSGGGRPSFGCSSRCSTRRTNRH